jgi:hypothetical protein
LNFIGGVLGGLQIPGGPESRCAPSMAALICLISRHMR